MVGTQIFAQYIRVYVFHIYFKHNMFKSELLFSSKLSLFFLPFLSELVKP